MYINIRVRISRLGRKTRNGLLQQREGRGSEQSSLILQGPPKIPQVLYNCFFLNTSFKELYMSMSLFCKNEI